MRVVVTGATGNVGTSTISALVADPGVHSVIGIARRRPRIEIPGVEWRAVDVLEPGLARHFEGADAVVHLAWLIQPSRDRNVTRAANVGGSERVFEAAAQAGVGAIVYASSVGAYSPGPKDRLVDESWPTDGIETSFYGRDKAEVERLLDRFEDSHPEIRVARLRPGLIFKRDAATEIRRLFIGPLAPSALFDRRLIPLVPDLDRLRFQAVHSLDVGEAYRLAVTRPVGGAFNIAAEPILDPPRLAQALGARRVKLPARALRLLADASWRLRLQPTPPGWLDMALGVPLMDTRRAREELGWSPTRGADEALLELLAGIHDRAGLATPPLDPESSGPLRVNEFRTGLGARAF